MRLLRAFGGGPVKAAVGLAGCVIAAIVLAAHDERTPAILFGVLAGWCAICMWLLIRFDDSDVSGPHGGAR